MVEGIVYNSLRPFNSALSLDMLARPLYRIKIRLSKKQGPEIYIHVILLLIEKDKLQVQPSICGIG